MILDHSHQQIVMLSQSFGSELIFDDRQHEDEFFLIPLTKNLFNSHGCELT